MFRASGSQEKNRLFFSICIIVIFFIFLQKSLCAAELTRGGAFSAEPPAPAVEASWDVYAGPGLPSPPQALADARSPAAPGGRSALLVLSLKIPRGSYIYAPFSISGADLPLPDDVYPTALKLDLPAYAPLFPPGGIKEDIYSGNRVFTYQDETPLFVYIPAEAAIQGFNLTLSGLLCSTSSCTPFSRNLHIAAPEIKDSGGLPAKCLKLLEQSRPPARQSVNNEGDGALAPAELPELNPVFFSPGLEVSFLWQAVLLGLAAGFLLNLMPCVLPVISLKLSALLNVCSLKCMREQRAMFRSHALFFALGILVWFGLLIVVLGGVGMLWGQFFQNLVLLEALAIIIFMLALSMLGVFSLPVLAPSFGQHRSPRLEAFWGGILATLLATPCSGPMLGGVLGWAVNQPAQYLALTIFSVGLGMALPFLIMAWRPGMVRFLPRPGAWTGVLEQVLSFFLLGTVVYLLWLLPESRLPVMLAVLLIISMAAWFWGRIGGLNAPPLRRKISRYVAVGLGCLALWVCFGYKESPNPWQNFEQERFAANLGQKAMLVEFTADWCANCKAQEYATLTSRRLKRWQEQYALNYVRVDLTRHNPEGQALLKSLGGASIPALAIFPTGQAARTPLVLRDLITPDQLKDALRQVFK